MCSQIYIYMYIQLINNVLQVLADAASSADDAPTAASSEGWLCKASEEEAAARWTDTSESRQDP